MWTWFETYSSFQKFLVFSLQAVWEKFNSIRVDLISALLYLFGVSSFSKLQSLSELSESSSCLEEDWGEMKNMSREQMRVEQYQSQL